MRLLCVLLIAVLSAGCSIIYKLPTRQGNVMEQKDLDQLKTGMTRDQVKFLLGTPLAANPFRNDRWEYLGYYKDQRGRAFNRIVTLWFDADNKLGKMEGVQMASAASELTNPDVTAILSADEKARLEDERAKEKMPEGIILQPTAPDAPDASKLPNP